VQNGYSNVLNIRAQQWGSNRTQNDCI